MVVVCVKCGQSTSKPLYENFGGNLRLTQCDSCQGFLDKYIECEWIIIFLDVLLHRLEVLRHLLFNTQFSSLHSYILCGLVLLCMAYGKLLAYEPVSGLLWVEKQPFFYVFFVHSVIEILQCFILQLLLVVWCLPSTSIRKRLLQSSKALLVSNAAALLVIPAMVWSDSWKGAYLQLPWILVMTSQVQTIRALLGSNLLFSIGVLGMARFAFKAANAYLLMWGQDFFPPETSLTITAPFLNMLTLNGLPSLNHLSAPNAEL